MHSQYERPEKIRMANLRCAGNQENGTDGARMRLQNHRARWRVGIDEVGRGALAGPVVVCALAAPVGARLGKKCLGPLRDSKQLTPRMRDAWFAYLAVHPQLAWAISRVTPRVIDRINISRAANRALFRAYEKLQIGNNRVFVYLDGGLAMPESIPHRTVIKGDEKIKIIAAASIIAKVCRDRAMISLHKKDPRYRFDIHKGYGTNLHRMRIKQYGHSLHHRRSFILKS